MSRIENMLQRQGYACATCLRRLTPNIAIDYTRERVSKGLVCIPCARALDEIAAPATLRRMIAFLERDPTKPLVYVIGALKNPRVPEIGIALRAEGFDAFDEWHTPGPHADENWQAYEAKRGRTYAEALRGRSAQNAFLFDRAYLDLADAVVLVMPAGKSAMLELGYACGRGKPAFILLDGADPERYDIMPAFATAVVRDFAELLPLLPRPVYP